MSNPPGGTKSDRAVTARPRRQNVPGHGSEWAKALLAELVPAPAGVRQIAAALGLEVREVETDGFEGALVRACELPLGAIVVRRSIREAGRKNFTIAHEIGHFVLPGHDRASLACTRSDVANWADHSEEKAFEREADEFAADLLMPASLVESIVNSATPSLAAIEKIARTSGSSLSAAAWRYCDLTDTKCAVVWTTDGVIQWVKRSPTFPFFILKSLEAKRTSIARCFERETVPGKPRPNPPHFWFECADLDPFLEMVEDWKNLPAYRSVISLLWIKNEGRGEGESIG